MGFFQIRVKNMPYNRREENNSFSSFCFCTEGVVMPRENKFQAKLIKDIESRFPGCIVIKNDANYIQGIPDLTVLYEDKWATLECKKSKNATHQPNQDDYVEQMNNMSFSAFIYPENKEEVLNELQATLRNKK